MRQVADDAESYLREYGEIGEGLRTLRAEIERVGGGGGYGTTALPPYGVAIRAAIASGDSGQMTAVAQQAEDWLKQADDVRAALAELRSATGNS
jgi:hypothetical protein